MNLKVSAVITTHNRLECLKRAIDSVLTQTYPNIECIVVSDNSTDGTNEYCSSRKDIKFISIPKEESHGGNYARNLGIKTARGKYVAFLDDDDYWFPNKIERQVALAIDKNCECVYCLRRFEHISANGLVSRNETGINKPFGNISKRIFRHSFTNTSCILATKSVLEEVGMFDENVIKLQEYELLVRIAQVSDIYYCDGDPLVGFTEDIQDKNRVSSGFYKFPIAKEYLISKHGKLIKKSGFINSFLFYDWMRTAMYRCAKPEKKWKYIIKYAPYYYISEMIKKLFRK